MRPPDGLLGEADLRAAHRAGPVEHEPTLSGSRSARRGPRARRDGPAGSGCCATDRIRRGPGGSRMSWLVLLEDLAGRLQEAVDGTVLARGSGGGGRAARRPGQRDRAPTGSARGGCAAAAGPAERAPRSAMAPRAARAAGAGTPPASASAGRDRRRGCRARARTARGARRPCQSAADVVQGIRPAARRPLRQGDRLVVVERGERRPDLRQRAGGPSGAAGSAGAARGGRRRSGRPARSRRANGAAPGRCSSGRSAA